MTTLAPPQRPASPPRPGASSSMRPPEDFFLPRGYRQQAAALTRDDAAHDAEGAPEYWNAQRIAAAARYQYHVYDWGARLIRRHRLNSILDIGCGPALKLAQIIAPACPPGAIIEGIDQASAVNAARAAGSPGHFRTVDLEHPESFDVERTFDLIICADVLEHLVDPDPAMRLMARCAHPSTRILLSTPDRARLRGRNCMESTKPEHIREWAQPEFERYVEARGFHIENVKLLPADDAPMSIGRVEELRWRAGFAEYSPHRCHTVLARLKRK